MAYTIVAFGEALWDLLPSGAVLGGAPLNLAYRVSSLGNRGIIVSSLGKDDLGQKAFEQIDRLEMESGYIQRDESFPTGTVDVRLDATGHPDFTIIENVAYDHIELTTEMIELVESADCFCFGTLIQRNADSRKTLIELLSRFAASRSSGRTPPPPTSAGLGRKAAPRPRHILLDINLRRNCYTEQTIRESIEHADILKLNEDEAPILAELYGGPFGGPFGGPSVSLPAIMDSLMEKTGLEYCVITLGPKGVFAASMTAERLYLPTYRVKLEDSCGSGDAFTAGFIHCVLGGESLKRACQFGNAMGALVAAQTGATQRVTLKAIEALIERAETEETDPVLKEFLPRSM